MGAEVARDMLPAVFARKLGIAAMLAGIQTSHSDDTKVFIRLSQNRLGQIAACGSGRRGDGASIRCPTGPLARTADTNTQSYTHSFPFPRNTPSACGCRRYGRSPGFRMREDPAASAFPAKPVAFGCLIRSRSRGRLLLRPRPCRIPFSPVTTGTEPICSLRLRARQVKDIHHDGNQPCRSGCR